MYVCVLAFLPYRRFVVALELIDLSKILFKSFHTLADFGFARFLHGDMMAATLCGSPMYMVSIFNKKN